jgi:Electron transfer DM13
MRYALLLSCILTFIMSACSKEGKLAPTTVLNEVIDTTMGMDSSTTASLIYSGTFSSGPFGTVTGKAEVYKTGISYVIQLANFNSSNGPALHVYLSKEAMPINYTDLGTLKSTAGNQVYSVSGMPDFTDYKYISIHCVAFNHLFGSALLK